MLIVPKNRFIFICVIRASARRNSYIFIDTKLKYRFKIKIFIYFVFVYCSCHPWSGKCECNAGWDGVTCSRPCPFNSYGEGCRNTCDCLHDAQCLPADGTCVCPPGKFLFIIISYFLNIATY